MILEEVKVAPVSLLASARAGNVAPGDTIDGRARCHNRLRRGAQLNPTQQALHQLRSGQYDEAIATSSKAIHAAPDEAENYLYRGRAYHYRNAMGDHGRAIADYSEAIRRAPKSSDAYYSRALAYRDLGEVKLATADEEQARELDRGLRDVYNRLPNASHLTEIAKETPQSDAAAEPEGTGGDSKKSEEDERKLYEELKDRFEPGFGTIRSSKKSDEEMVADELQKARKELYQSMMAPPSYSLPSATEGGEGNLPGGNLRRNLLGGVDVSQPPGDEAASAENAPAAVPGGASTPWPLGPQQAPQRGRAPSAMTPNPRPNNLTSPFPQHTPAPTGYVAPPLANPFAAPPSSATGRSSTIGQPFNSGSSVNRFTNPSVRPPNPRDYLP